MPELSNFQGQPVTIFDGEEHVQFDPPPTTVSVYLGYDSFDEGRSFEEVWASFCGSMDLDAITRLIIGPWDYEMDVSADEIIGLIVAQASALQNLEALFFGDFSGDDTEISWILNGDVGPLLEAFPNLDYFGVRGGQDLRFKGCKGHARLHTLVVETGGLDAHTVEDILSLELPELRKLELWLGDSNYGFSGSIDTYLPFIVGRPYPDLSYPFPKLEHLGLRNAEISDDLAHAFLDAPVLSQLKTLDLSMGTLSNHGARALLDNHELGHLDALDLSSNYINDPSLLERLEARGISITYNNQKDDEKYGRYVDVGE